MGYNVADNIGSIFISLAVVCFLPNLRNPREIQGQFELIAGQGHPRLSILVPIESAYATSY